MVKENSNAKRSLTPEPNTKIELPQADTYASDLPNLIKFQLNFFIIISLNLFGRMREAFFFWFFFRSFVGWRRKNPLKSIAERARNSSAYTFQTTNQHCPLARVDFN